MARVTVKRSKQLADKLKALRDEASPMVKIAMERVAGIIVTSMRSLVPVDQGDLRDSIGWTWGDAPKGSISMSHQKGDYRITIYAGNEKAYYARWVEFGTAPHAIGKGSDVSRGAKKQYGAMHPGTAPQPFFYPAYRMHKKKLKREINKSIRNEVKRIAAQ